MARTTAWALLRALFELFFGDGVGYDSGAGLDVALFAVHEEGADGDAGVKVAVEVGVEDAAAIDSAAGGFELFDDLHGADFGGSAEGAGGEAGAEGVDGREIGAELAFEGADEVHDVAVALDEHEVFDADAAELADAADVVAAEVDEHDVFGDFFVVGAEVGFDGAVFDLVGGAGTGAGDGTVLDVAAVDADEELG